MNRIDKRYFSDAQIAAIRRKWTVERTIDECLTRKLERRRGDDYALPALPDLTARLSAWMQDEISPGARAENLKRIPGGGSKEMFFFDLLDGNQRQRRVLRMNPGESIVETHRLREFQVMPALLNRKRVFKLMAKAPRPDLVDESPEAEGPVRTAGVTPAPQFEGSNKPQGQGAGG